jgi:glycosyltransferase involved in cell wall biosynthesis
LRIEGIGSSEHYEKYSYIARYVSNVKYKNACNDVLHDFRPDVVLSGNAAPDIQASLLRACHRQGSAFVYWVQDFYGEAIGRLLRKRFGFFGSAVGTYFRYLDASVLRQSDSVVLITHDFVSKALKFGVNPDRCHVIENWAVIDELPFRPRLNEWSRAHGLDGKITLLYAGTLGLKHNPALILKLAMFFRSRPDIAVVVVSEGLGRQWLDAQKTSMNLPNLHLLDFQPFEVVPDMIATGDVLLATIDEGASEFSVPSKVATYLCAGRPILLAAPATNLATRTVIGARAGVVVNPGDAAGFLRAAEELVTRTQFAEKCGKQARTYAETAFRIGPIADRFERVLQLARNARRNTYSKTVPQFECDV